jgi:acyl-coenzyme A synthetase/AMP-(fatty) acid ligase
MEIIAEWGTVFLVLAVVFGLYMTRGIGANDRVVLLSGNSIEHLIVYLSVLAHGATICTVNVEMNHTYLGDLMAALDPRLVIDQEGLGLSLPEEDRPRIPLGEWSETPTGLFAEIQGLPAVPPPPPVGSEDDDACIYFTSGTSDRPKGVILTARELLDNVEPVTQAFAITEKDRILDFRSFNWASAQILSALAPLASGATLILAHKFSQRHFLEWIRDTRATIAAGNPTIVNMMLNRERDLTGADLPDLRFITSSSAPLLVDEWKRFEARFAIKIAQGYGSSETGWIAGSNETTRRLGTVGKPLAYLELAVVDNDGKPLPAGEIGHIEMGNVAGRRYRYLGLDGAVHDHATGRIRTGDLGRLDEDGYLTVTGREKDLIIRGGVNIAPLEIDALLQRHPDVMEAATVGVPDPIWGEEVVTFVALKPGASANAQALIDYARSELPHAKSPKAIVLRDALPKNERGKMDRKALAAEWSRLHANARRAAIGGN